MAAPAEGIISHREEVSSPVVSAVFYLLCVDRGLCWYDILIRKNLYLLVRFSGSEIRSLSIFSPPSRACIDRGGFRLKTIEEERGISKNNATVSP